MGQTASGAFDGTGTGVFPGGFVRRSISCTYSFAVQGGAVSSIVIGHLPLGTRIVGGYMNVATAVTGAGASVAVQAEGANDIVASAAISGAPWSTTGMKAIIPKLNTPESTSVVTTAERDVVAVISGAVVTAGVFTVVLEVQGAG